MHLEDQDEDNDIDGVEGEDGGDVENGSVGDDEEKKDLEMKNPIDIDIFCLLSIMKTFVMMNANK